MAMSDQRILNAIDDDLVVIEPFDERSLATSSYDVRLGQFFYREQEPELDNSIFNIYDQEQVKKVWGAAQTAPLAMQVLPDKFFERPSEKRIIEPLDQVILIGPGETILAHTVEFIGARKSITTMMKARSSLGRSFILVCKCAGWGDVGYVNRWTFEITNVSRHYSIPLLVGSRVAQIVFLETGDIRDKDYSQTGAYQTSDDIETIKETWTPDTMLPKIRK